MSTSGFSIDAVAEEPLPTAKEIPLHPEKILVAEDEHLIAMDLAGYLKGLGFDVVGPANNGRKAVELAKEHRPDLALVDVRMPQMDGLEAAGILFCQMNIPVIIVSSYPDAQYVERATRIGVFGYLLKPVTPDRLRVNIAVAWSRYRQHMLLRQQIAQLEAKLDERKIIEKAKGLLMKKLGISEEEAYERLRKKARDSRRKIADLARAILETSELLEEDGR